MVEFLNKDASYAKIVEIVSKAVNNLVLITPYIKIPDDLLERLRYMDNKGVKTTVVCRERDLKPDEKSALKKLKYIDLRFDEDLHAKCFYNEESMVITSLNLYEHSQLRNREMGILLNLKEEPDIFQEALEEAEFIVGRAKKDSTFMNIARSIVKEAKKVIDSPVVSDARKPITSSRAKTATRTTTTGFCIRCGKSIAFKLDAPYCPACFRTWNKYKDPDYEEEYCHVCGTPNEQTTFNKPSCYSCYRKSSVK